MLFGVSKEIITPPFKMQVACTGEYEKNFDSVHDDLFVRCLVLKNGDATTVLLAYDLLFHDRSLNCALEEHAFKVYGVKKDAVVVACTHAHTAPAVKGYNPGHHDDRYEELIIEKGKLAIDNAMNSLAEGYLEYGSSNIGLNVSRRGIVNGVYLNAPNFNYEHDQELFVLAVKNLNNEVKSVLINYACHPVFYPAFTTISGEFPAKVCSLTDEKYGAVSLYFQSAGGDVRPYPTVDKREDGTFGFKKLGFDGISEFASDLFSEVEKLLSTNLNRVNPKIEGEAFTVNLEMQPAGLEYFEKQWDIQKSSPGNAYYENSNRIAHGGYEKLPTAMPLHLQLIRLSDRLCIATVGGEPCYTIKTTVKEALKGLDVCFIGYTDACAYLPGDKILKEGGYEAECHLEYGHIGPFKFGIDDKLKTAFKKSLEKLN